METKQSATLYCVHFKGIYGRNRSAKFTCSKPAEVEAGPDGVDVRKLAGDYVAEIKAKSGFVCVTRYDDCEITTYHGEGGDGGDIVIHTIPVTQGVTVFATPVEGGAVVTSQPAGPRALRDIAREIRADWKNIYFGAVPYLDALATLGSVDDAYGLDDARSIVNYFLANANAWRGDVARRVKAELKALVK